MITAKKIQRFHVLLARTRLMDQKPNILSGYGVESTKELKEFDLDGLIAWLESEVKWADLKDYQFALFDNNNNQHRYLLSICQEYGWTVFDHKRGRNIADLNRLGAWIRKRSQVKKPLLQMTNKEVQKTVYQFEQMTKKHFEK